MMLVAQRDSDGLGWIQILVFVIVIVVYALGGLLKSRSSKFQQADEEPQPRQPKRKPPGGRALPRRPLPTRARRPSVSPAAPAQYPTPRRPPAGKILRPPPPAATEQMLPIPESAPPELAELPSAVLLDELTETADARQAQAEEEPPYLPQLLSDYADPEQLRTAILHYEILGKPLSLRDPSAHIIGP